MSNESILSKTQLINQSYGSILSKDTTPTATITTTTDTTTSQPRPMPRLSHRRNKLNLANNNSIDDNNVKDNRISTIVVNSNYNLPGGMMDNGGKLLVNKKNKSENGPALVEFSVNGGKDNEKLSSSSSTDLVTVDNHQSKNNSNSFNTGKKNILMKSLVDPESASITADKYRPYPKYVFFIIGNEFCERFSFYGLRAILVLYFRDVLGFSDSSSTISFHLFMTLCYFTPIFGAILGDSILGKYRTILYLSSVYFIGEFLLVISSLIWNNHALSIGLTILSLVLIGGGTGGIKPCVSALSGDQFLPSEQQRIQNFFSMFYFSINAGSLISTFLTPVLRNDFHCLGRSDCFPLAFGIPCLLMFIGLIFFIAAKSKYTIVPLPKDNVLLSFVKSIHHALKNKWARKRKSHKNQAERSHDEPGSSDASTLTVNTLPSSTDSPSDAAETRILERSHWIYYALDKYNKRTLDEFKSVLAVLVLFLPLPVFWCLFDQQSSRWTLQATRMDGNIFGFNLKPDQIQVANPLLVLLLIPIFDIFIYPLFNKCGIIKTPLQRMTTGGILAGLTFFSSALIEQRIDRYSPVSVVPQGQGHLTITNGMSNCDLVYPKFFIDQILQQSTDTQTSTTTDKQQLDIIDHLSHHVTVSPLSGGGGDTSEDSSHFGDNNSVEQLKLNKLGPLESKSVGLLHDNNSYRLMFNLQTPPPLANNNSSSGSNVVSSLQPTIVSGCPLDNDIQYNVSLPKFHPGGQSKLLYIYQGNGEINYTTFDDDIVLPRAGFAKVKVIMDIMVANAHLSIGSLSIVPSNEDKSSLNPNKQTLQFKTFESTLFSTDYNEVEAQNNNNFTLLFPKGMKQEPVTIKLEPGSRNLILVHEYEPKKFTIKLQQLQDNKYMISVLWQLIPYVGISAGELMFSITGLEFSYSVAPKSMKSMILGLWCLTTAFGNLLTVAVESMHLFTNIATEFYFYGTLMILDMIIFAWLAYFFDAAPTATAATAVENHAQLTADIGQQPVVGDKYQPPTNKNNDVPSYKEINKNPDDEINNTEREVKANKPIENDDQQQSVDAAPIDETQSKNV